jgi:hypothetical protein
VGVTGASRVAVATAVGLADAAIVARVAVGAAVGVVVGVGVAALQETTIKIRKHADRTRPYFIRDPPHKVEYSALLRG